MLKGSLLFSVLFLLFFSPNLSSQELVKRKISDKYLLEKIDNIYASHPEYGLYSLDIPVENVELIHLRTERSKTFYGADGQYRTQQTGGIFHYKNTTGEWLSIQDKISKKGNTYGIFQSELPIKIDINSGLTEMTLAKSGEKFHFGKNVNIEFVDKNGNITDKLTPSYNSSAVTGNDLFLNNIYDGIDRYQRIEYWSVKTDYFIHKKLELPENTAYIQFTDNISLPVGWTIEYGDGYNTELGWQGDLVVKNRAGQIVSGISIPKYYDDSEKGSFKNDGIHDILGTYQIEKSNGNFIIKMIIPVSWLNNPNLKYPLVIDPTTTNTYAASQGLEDKNNQFQATCQATMNLNFPPAGLYKVTGTNTSYTIWAKGYQGSAGSTQIYADKVEQRSRVCSLNGCTAIQQGTGTNHSSTNPSYYTIANNSINYNLTNQTIANGCYRDRPTIPFTWQGYQTFLPYGSGGAQMNLTGCRTDYQELVANTWVVTVTYTLITDENATVTPLAQNICSGQNAIISAYGGTNPTYSWAVAQTGVSGGTNVSSATSINQALTATGSNPGTATYTITPSFDGCPGTPINAVVTVNPAPVITITNNAPSLCGNGNSNIAVSVTPAGASVNWSVSVTGTVSGAQAGSGTSVNQALTGAGTATYTFTALLNGCPATGTATVTLTSNTTNAITGPDEVCQGSTITLVTNQPTGGTITQVGNDRVHTFTSSGSFNTNGHTIT